MVYVGALLALDLTAGAGALALAYWARFGVSGEALGRYAVLSMLALAAWVLAARVVGLYDRDRLLGGTDEYAMAVQSATYALIAVVLIDFAFAASAVSRAWLLLSWAGLVAFAGGGRFLARRVAFAARSRGAFRSRLIVVGADDRAVALAAHLDGQGFEVLGFLDDFRPAGSRPGGGPWPVLGAASQVHRIDELAADEVIVVPTAISWESKQIILDPFRPRTFKVHVLATRENALTAGVRLRHRGNVPVYAFSEARLDGIESALKRALDIALASVLIAVVGPFALGRIVTRAFRHMPLVERREYARPGGRHVATYELAGDGSRLVKKLPGALSVLTGSMSIVGPTLSENGDTPAEVLLMRPGLTSVVPPPQRSLGPEASMSIQLDYVRNYSIWRDLQVVWHRTLSAWPRPHRNGVEAQKVAQSAPAAERARQEI